MRRRVNISLTEDTAERLKQYAWEQHKNVSQAITDWIWSTKVKNEQIRGQQTIKGLAGEKGSRSQLEKDKYYKGAGRQERPHSL